MIDMQDFGKIVAIYVLVPVSWVFIFTTSTLADKLSDVMWYETGAFEVHTLLITAAFILMLILLNDLMNKIIECESKFGHEQVEENAYTTSQVDIDEYTTDKVVNTNEANDTLVLQEMSFKNESLVQNK